MSGRWVFGADWCDAWHSLDVLASTASILNLCVISLDRYWAITNPISYPCKMSDSRASLLILLVWVCSAAISFPAIAWWRAVAPGPPPPYECPFTEDTGECLKLVVGQGRARVRARPITILFSLFFTYRNLLGKLRQTL